MLTQLIVEAFLLTRGHVAVGICLLNTTSSPFPHLVLVVVFAALLSVILPFQFLLNLLLRRLLRISLALLFSLLVNWRLSLLVRLLCRLLRGVLLRFLLRSSFVGDFKCIRPDLLSRLITLLSVRMYGSFLSISYSVFPFAKSSGRRRRERCGPFWRRIGT